jgi:hypothetical protein
LEGGIHSVSKVADRASGEFAAESASSSTLFTFESRGVPVESDNALVADGSRRASVAVSQGARADGTVVSIEIESSGAGQALSVGAAGQAVSDDIAVVASVAGGVVISLRIADTTDTEGLGNAAELSAIYAFSA